MKAFKVIGKAALKVILAIIALGIAAAAYFAICGAVMYYDAVSKTPVGAAAEEIRARDDFVGIDELPEFYINAVKAVEDRSFDTHCGINPKSIARALWHDLCTLSLEQGGSTITQQLAKNLYYTQDKKLQRKFAEIYTAFALEKELSKDEIFELYVNTIYFGSGYYGISAAAMGYYGKLPAELSEYECAMLAGLPNAPSVYSPDASPTLAEQRLEQVLNAMLECEFISREEMNKIFSSSL